MKKNLIAIVSLIAVTLFISLKSIAQQIDPINDAEITITKENTKVTKPMGTAEDKANTKTLRRLTVTLDGVEAKDKITQAHSDKNLFMVRTEDSPLIMITEQIDNKYGVFFMSFSGALDSSAQGTGPGGEGATPSFLGKGIGKIGCSNYFVEKLDSCLYAGHLAVDTKHYSYSCKGNRISLLKYEIDLNCVQDSDGEDCYGLYYNPISGKIVDVASINKSTCSICRFESFFTRNYQYELPISSSIVNGTIILPRWVEYYEQYNRITDSARSLWEKVYCYISFHENKHHEYIQEFYNQVYKIKYEGKICYNAGAKNWKSFSNETCGKIPNVINAIKNNELLRIELNKKHEKLDNDFKGQVAKIMDEYDGFDPLTRDGKDL